MEYSDAALSRLVVSDVAREISDAARTVVMPDEDSAQAMGELLSITNYLVQLAQDLQRQAVICARERPVSWARIGDALSVTRQSAQERYGRDVAAWRDVLYDPDRARELGPVADPDGTVASLSRWLATDGRTPDVAGALPQYDAVTRANDLLKRTQWIGDQDTVSSAVRAAYDQRKAQLLSE